MITLSIRKAFLFLILNALSIYGQGIIRGSVIDSLTMDQLKGAEIILTGTNFKAVSNTDGEFFITGIPSGEYILQASYLGYKEKQYLIKIESDETLKLRVELLPTITIEDGVAFTQQARGQAQEINQEIRSNTIKNVIASRKLQDLPDENIPVTLSRLPGVSVMRAPLFTIVPLLPMGSLSTPLQTQNPPQNDFSLLDDPVSRVYVRGLSSKYSNITVDGIRISPTSAKDKSVNLGILSERDFQSIEVRKTTTSDEDGDATAGAINFLTGKAPYTRVIKAEFLGNDNRLDNSANQYDFTGSYGERFFDDVLGVQVNANVEKKVLSYEYHLFNNFMYTEKLSYTNSVRKRNGGNVLVDLITPDGGSITFNTFFNKVHTGYFESRTDPDYSGPLHTFCDRETEQQVFLSSIGGIQYLLGFNVDWNVAFSESQHNHPVDYSLTFLGPPSIPGTPPWAMFPDYLSYTLNIPSRNYCRERTASIDIHRKYKISNEITGEIKFGGKYRVNSRVYDENLREEEEPLYKILLSSFEDNPPRKRTLFGEYEISLINKNALSSFRQSDVGKNYPNNEPDINSYNTSENVSAVYLMHNLDFGKSVKFITGLRIESEHNDYSGYYFPNIVGETNVDPVSLYNGLPKQTDTYRYNKTTLLPNFQMILCPTNFLNLRLAAYKTLIRPDCVARMPKYFSVISHGSGGEVIGVEMVMGNPDLKNADIWNYEFQTQFYGNNIGQFSINAFYKDIEGMVHATNGIALESADAIESLGINWRNYVSNFPFTNSQDFSFYSYFNSPKPTRIWGFEIEHNADFRYLPGLLKNIVLNYNFTFLRSETWTKDAVWLITTTPQCVLTDKKQKLSHMPEFLANVNLGYDIKGFSFRISYFYQGEYQMYDDYFGYFVPTQIKESKLSRLDIAVKQQVLKNFYIILKANNITDSKEEALYKYSSYTHWRTAQAYKYGPNFDFGIGIEL